MPQAGQTDKELKAILGEAVQMEKERRALSATWSRGYRNGQVPRAQRLGDFDQESQTAMYGSRLAQEIGMDSAERSFHGLIRTEADRTPASSVVTECYFPPRYPGKPGPDATAEEIMVWNEYTKTMTPEELVASMGASVMWPTEKLVEDVIHTRAKVDAEAA